MMMMMKKMPVKIFALNSCTPHTTKGRSPAAKRYLVNFRQKISPLIATIFRSFSGNETLNWGDWVAKWYYIIHHKRNILQFHAV